MLFLKHNFYVDGGDSKSETCICKSLLVLTQHYRDYFFPAFMGHNKREIIVVYRMKAATLIGFFFVIPF